MKCFGVFMLTVFIVSLVFIDGVKGESFFEKIKSSFRNGWHAVSSYFTKPKSPVVNKKLTTLKYMTQVTEKVTETTDRIEQLKGDPSTTEKRAVTEKVQTAQEIRDAYFEINGQRISETKCQAYKANYEFTSLLNNSKVQITHQERPKPHKDQTVDEVAIGGRNTTPGEFPHMGALGWISVSNDWTFKCGSSLISHNFLLTAAHCSWISPKRYSVIDPKPKIVRLGTTNIGVELKDYAVDVEILEIIVHPEYNSPKVYNDIALMKINAVTFNTQVQPGCVWLDPAIMNKETKIFGTGWGYTSVVNKSMSMELQAIEVVTIHADECDQILQVAHNRRFNGLRASQMCAGNLTGGVDTCQGDSGGPIQVKMQSVLAERNMGMSCLIGVTSFGHGCAQPGMPSVYTRISSYIDWIEDNVWHDDLKSGGKDDEDY